jgi:uncharacterized protein (UPF0147 family)
MKLIDKSEQIKDFIMILLKYYQNNGCELFQQIYFLLQAIVNDEKYPQLIRSTNHQVISFNQSSILYLTSKIKRPSVISQNENILKQNLISIKQFTKVFFYRD